MAEMKSIFLIASEDCGPRSCVVEVEGKEAMCLSSFAMVKRRMTRMGWWDCGKLNTSQLRCMNIATINAEGNAELSRWYR